MMFMMLGMFVLWLLVGGGIVALVVWAVRELSGRRTSENPALSILGERYARGEIGSEEYETRRRQLLQRH